MCKTSVVYGEQIMCYLIESQFGPFDSMRDGNIRRKNCGKDV